MDRKTGVTAGVTNFVAVKIDVESDKRDITDLWAEALSQYDGIVGFDLKPTFVNVDSMIANGEKSMNEFHRFRHDQKKVDKLRSIFSANMSLIEEGAKQIVAAATPAFPPAAAIGTALTFVLAACKSVSADYDVVTAFFEDMNNFLQRVTILVKRSPQNTVWQKTLLGVFTSFLKMCGFAHKYIQKGRFRKWVTNAIFGEDGELADARKGMDASLKKLQAATEFATLGNTEELKQMNDELRENQEAQLRLAESQSIILQTLLEQQSGIQDDMKRLMQLLEQQKKDDKTKSKTAKMPKEVTANRVRYALSVINGVDAEIQSIRDSFVPETASWIFEEESWKAWETLGPDSPSLLVIKGPAGIGKSHLALSVADHLRHSNDVAEGQQAIVTYFPCREASDDLKYCSWVLSSTIAQVSDQSLELRDRLDTILSDDIYEVDDADSWEAWKKLFIPLFRSSSKHRLIMVIDGLDELADDDEREELLRCARHVQFKGFKIKMFCTTRPNVLPHFVTPGSVEIDMTKAKIIPDLRRIVWNRMQNYATEYQGLTRFSKYVKQRIASRMEEAADGLLYTEHMMRYLARMAREAVVIKELEEAMPNDITDLFSTMLSQSQRRTPTGQFGTIRLFLAWIAFAFRPLTLDELIEIVKSNTVMTARRTGRIERFDLEDEIQYTYSRFLQVGSSISGRQESMMTPTAMMKDFKMGETPGEGHDFTDEGLEVKFRERSMREFFSNAADGEESLRMPASIAHRTIFMYCCRIIRRFSSSSVDDEHFSSSKSLHKYAVREFLNHWMAIDMAKHSDEDNFEVIQTLSSLFSDHNSLAAGLERLGGDFDLADGTYDDCIERLAKWRNWLAGDKALIQRLKDKTGKDDSIDLEDLAAALAKSHVQNWFTAPDAAAALRSYRFARRAVTLSEKLKPLLDEDYDPDEDVNDDTEETMDLYDGGDRPRSKDEIIGIADTFGIEKTSNAYFAIAVILSSRGNREEAARNVENAIEMCHSSLEQFRNYQLLAFIYWELERSEEALHFIDLCLQSTEGASPAAIRRAHVIRARIQIQQGNIADAAETFRTARLGDAMQIAKVRHLYEEYVVYMSNEDYAGYMKVLHEWQPIERLNFFTFHYEWDERVGPETIVTTGTSAKKSGNVDQLIEMLEQVIKSLDVENAGAPLRINLAWVYWRLRRDAQTAKAILNIVLLNTSDGHTYKLTDHIPTLTAWRAANMMTDILYHEFQASSDPSIKTSLYEEVESLRQKPLVQSVQTPPSCLVPHLLVLARMAQKLGPMTDFERIMKQVFDYCMDLLKDPGTTRHGVTMYHLALVLHQMGMRKDARICFSAIFYTFHGATKDGELTDTVLKDVSHDADGENKSEKPEDDSEESETEDEDESESSEDEDTDEDEDGDDDDDDDKDDEGDRDDNDDDGDKSEAENTDKAEVEDKEKGEVEAEDMDEGKIKVEDKNKGEVEGNGKDKDKHEGENENEDQKEGEDEDKGEGETEDGDEGEGDDEDDADDDADERVYDMNDDIEFHCRGMCMPESQSWKCWDVEESGRMYQCVFCTECRLCRSCYDIRMRHNKRGRKKKTEPDFCCDKGEYLVGPMKGWLGIESGMIYIKDKPPKNIQKYLTGLERRWEEKWTEFWSG